VAGQLEVDSDGLRSGAAGSDAVAAALASAAVDGVQGNQPSHGAVSAILAAAESVRGAQSARVNMQAGDMRAGGGRYEDTDGRAADSLARSM
jgi:hypothetical protein